MTADPIGGVWTYALDLIQEFSSYGVEFALCTMGRQLREDQRKAVAALSNAQLFESSYRLEWMHHPWPDVAKAGDWLLRIAEEVQPDLIHLNNFCHGQLAWNRPCLVVAHSDVFSWFRWVKNASPGKEWDQYRDEVKKGLAGADHVVAPSRASLQDLLREYGPLKSTQVIPNGRSEFGFFAKEKENFVLTAGRIWDEAKNISLLDEIGADIPIEILAAGDKGTGKAKSLKLLGELSQPQLAEYFARAAIYALPAKYEPFGLSILEAAINGCAIVLGDIPSLRENWIDCAIFVDPDDANAWRETLTELARNERMRREYGNKAREVARFYSARKMGVAYNEAYKKLCARSALAAAIRRAG